MCTIEKITIIGLGYVGFPLAVQAASRGFTVCGYDVNQSTVDAVNNKTHFLHDSFVRERIEHIEIKAATELFSSDVYIVCVPTPVSNFSDPDFTFVRNAVESIAGIIEDGQLVVIESTINPGVSEDLVAPILDKSGKRYYLAHCPERINPGDPKWTVANIPRVVGGIDAESTRRAAGLYQKLIEAEVTELSQIAAAESTKILENTFRDVNIAFVNEMAQSFYKLGIDIAEVIRGAATKPFGFMPHYPGIGVGGHCIAVDPYYMIQRGKQVGFDHIFLKQARKINSEMPEFAVRVLQDGLNQHYLPLKGTVIAVLGLSYKPDIADDRESPAYELIKLLTMKGAKLHIYDPYVPEKSNVGSLEAALAESKAAVLVTAHSEFLDESLYLKQKVILDGRNCLDKRKFSETNGPSYLGIGIRR